MFIYALGYALICISIFLLVIGIRNIEISGPKHHRVRELNEHWQFIHPTKREIEAKKIRIKRKTMLDEIDDHLQWCNNPYGITAGSFALLVLLFSCISWGGICLMVLNSSIYDSIKSYGLLTMLMVWSILLLLLILIFIIPMLVLKAVAQKRRRKLQKQFLYLLNYFQVFLKTGIMPMDIIKEIILFIPDPLQGKMIQLFAEIQVFGEVKAFQRFAELLNFKEALEFRNTIIDSLQLGSDAAAVCSDLAKEMREAHKFELIQRIKKKPFIILIPKLCFVVSILCIVSVPVLYKILDFANLG